jgi:amidase
MTELHDLTAVEQVDAIAARKVSSVELVQHYLRRIERHDTELRCFITVLADHALAGAKAADDDLAAGADIGLLHGLPLALKDMHPAAGLRTTFGSAAFDELVTPADGPAISRLRQAGAVVIGKTNTPEFGPTCYTDSAVGGTTVNPYDTRLSPSGSSGGAAAAVAAGLVGIAHGSDGLGSIRTPAANCGLVGFKTSRGRSAGSGLGWLALATEGPLARTVADTALFLDAMGGATDGDLWQAPAQPSDAFRTAAKTSLSGSLRIGLLLSPGRELDVHPDCLAAVDVAVQALRGLGHEIVDVPASSVPPTADLREAVKTMLGASMGQVAALAVPADQQHLLMPYTRWLLETNTGSATDYATSQAVLGAGAVRFRELLRGYDVVLTPTTTAPPLPTAVLRDDDGPGSFDVMGRWSAFTPAANLAGTPAVSLPVHHTAEGVPIGVQVLGPAAHDELLMSLAAQLEPIFRWQDHHPPAWGSTGRARTEPNLGV